VRMERAGALRGEGVMECDCLQHSSDGEFHGGKVTPPAPINILGEEQKEG